MDEKEQTKFYLQNYGEIKNEISHWKLANNTQSDPEELFFKRMRVKRPAAIIKGINKALRQMDKMDAKVVKRRYFDKWGWKYICTMENMSATYYYQHKSAGIAYIQAVLKESGLLQ